MTQDPFGVHMRDQVDAAERDALNMNRHAASVMGVGAPWESTVADSPLTQYFKSCALRGRLRACAHLMTPQPVICNLMWTSTSRETVPDVGVIVACVKCALTLAQKWTAIFGGSPEEFKCDMCRGTQEKGLHVASIVFGVTTLIAGLCDDCREKERPS